MLEILGSPLTLAKVSEQVGQMDAAAKVVVVDRQTFFEVLHAHLEVLRLFVAHAQVVERVSLGRAMRLLLFDLNLDGLVESLDGWLPLGQLVQDLALEEQSLRVIRLNLDKLGEELLALLDVFLGARLLEESSGELDHDLGVLGALLVGALQVLNTLLDLLLASNDAPSESELDLADDLIFLLVRD